jgi:uncharacterized protein (TIGR00255 family)
MAPIRSMTAFSRLSEQSSTGHLVWEIRAVNHRYLDLGIRLPDFLSPLEVSIREILRQQLQRGRVDCILKYQPGEGAGLKLAVNMSMVRELIQAAGEIQKLLGTVKAPNPLEILRWPNVLQEAETNLQAVQNAVMGLFEKTLKEFLLAREREGLALQKVILQTLVAIDTEAVKILQRVPEVLLNQKTKLQSRLSEIKAELDFSRLEQEMVFFAHKIDIAEELDRLGIHLKEFHRILQAGGSIGKRLDFLLQELNRETNTIASKSTDVVATQAAVEIKVLLEQIREQVQNLE